jgi:hypothetical protein
MLQDHYLLWLIPKSTVTGSKGRNIWVLTCITKLPPERWYYFTQELILRVSAFLVFSFCSTGMSFCFSGALCWPLHFTFYVKVGARPFSCEVCSSWRECCGKIGEWLDLGQVKWLSCFSHINLYTENLFG